MSEINIEIDRIVLTGLRVPPERAEHIRALVEVELQRLLEGGGRFDRMDGGEVLHMEASAINMTEPHNDARLASGLAQSIAQALQSGGYFGVNTSELAANP